MNILRIGKVEVEKLHCALLRQPYLWNGNKMRTCGDTSPHREVDDIWVRYNDNPPEDQSQPLELMWLAPTIYLPEAKDIAMQVLRMVDGTRLGGVLITRVPAGKQVYPHSDIGWHALNFDKYAVQIANNDYSHFHHEGSSFNSEPGDVYWFNNQAKHWVTNSGPTDRITMIVCVSGV